ncbi:hypothetical protein FPV67DRAFT_1447977 [Lyophyllum atratum]|nr:hypothetical protein FPV67DRAFT_1447977 [Lyophyllum atratum]
MPEEHGQNFANISHRASGSGAGTLPRPELPGSGFAGSGRQNPADKSSYGSFFGGPGGGASTQPSGTNGNAANQTPGSSTTIPTPGSSVSLGGSQALPVGCDFDPIIAKKQEEIIVSYRQGDISKSNAILGVQDLLDHCKGEKADQKKLAFEEFLAALESVEWVIERGRRPWRGKRRG